MCCGNSILQKGLPFFYLHKIFYTLIKSVNPHISILVLLIIYLFIETYSPFNAALLIWRLKRYVIFLVEHKQYSK
ncbi:hypothetical protein D4M42_11125 [Enterococcus gallinarum]|nr:hypothetical protein D4M42_11125 [Enterococcus gallinarum]